MSLVDWYSEKIAEQSYIIDSKVSDRVNNIIEVSHEEGMIYHIALITEDEVTMNTLSYLDLDLVDFILNHKKEAYIHSCFYEPHHSFRLSVGNFGDLLHALLTKNLHDYTSKEMSFIIRGLKQHDKVKSIQRLDNRRIEIQRLLMSTVTILVVNDYEITAESIRHNKRIFKNFNAIVFSNPYASASSFAINLAQTLNIELLKYGQLLRKLHKRKF